MTETSIGFIGLGSLGTPIAANILESGHKLFVFNRTADKTTPFVSKGANACATVAELAKQCKIVFTIVSDDAALKSICEGENGLLKNLAPGSIHVSMSTILPETASFLNTEHKKYNQQYLASPVFGRPEAAVAKKLNFVTSGDEAIRKQIEPLLKDAGAIAVWDFGNAIEAANTVKLCGNFMIAAALQAIGESIGLAQKSGVDAQQMLNMLTQTLFTSPVYVNYGNIILHQKFEPAAFTMKLGLKDINLVLAQAASSNHTMPVASLLQNKMQNIVASGKENIDWSAVGATNI